MPDGLTTTAQRLGVFPADFSLPPQLLPPPLGPPLHSLDLVIAARTTFLILILSTFFVSLTDPISSSLARRVTSLALLLSLPKDSLLVPMLLRPFDLAPVDSVLSFPSPPFRLLNSNLYANGPGIAT
ncbi:hypothetical protein EDB83DRAFT_2530240 [Lactarius deliciosus]|nr:hypothetical protein EDB83DRAFT_2530240 [Lactarius deliciosus]